MNENTTTPIAATNENNTVTTGASLTDGTKPSTVATNASTVATNASAAATADNQNGVLATSNLTSSGNKTLSSFATSASGSHRPIQLPFEVGWTWYS